MRVICFFAIVCCSGLLGVDQARAADVAAPVLLSVKVPETAEILIDGYRTGQRGAVRQFLSPPIPVGQAFTYAIQVKSPGKEQTQTIKVRAGDLVSLDFGGPSVTVVTEPAGTTVRSYSSYYVSPEPAPVLIRPVQEFDPWAIVLEMY